MVTIFIYCNTNNFDYQIVFNILYQNLKSLEKCFNKYKYVFN